jgi:hypothetical protein
MDYLKADLGSQIPSHLLWVNQAKRRYYRLRCCRDLFGEIYLVRTWGSLDSGRSNVKIHYLSPSELSPLVKSIVKRRENRGYRLSRESKFSWET